MNAAEYLDELPIPPDPADERAQDEHRHAVLFVRHMLFDAAVARSFAEAAWPLKNALGQMHRRPPGVLTNPQKFDLLSHFGVLTARGIGWPDAPLEWTADMLAVGAAIYFWSGVEATRDERGHVAQRTKRLRCQCEVADLNEMLGENTVEDRRAAIAAGHVIELSSRRNREIAHG